MALRDGKGFLARAISEEEAEEWRRHERTGSTLGGESFAGRMKEERGRVGRVRGHGSKPRQGRNGKRVWCPRGLTGIFPALQRLNPVPRITETLEAMGPAAVRALDGGLAELGRYA